MVDLFFAVVWVNNSLSSIYTRTEKISKYIIDNESQVSEEITMNLVC